jgi:hypothetical protein
MTGGGTKLTEEQLGTSTNVTALVLVKETNAPSNLANAPSHLVTRAFEGQQDAPKDAAIRALSVEVESPIRRVAAVLTFIYPL